MEVEVVVLARVHLFESFEKVAKAIRNLFPDAEVRSEGREAIAELSGIDSLSRVKSELRKRRVLAAARRLLERNARGNVTWLYFNKQAAYSGVAVLCEEEEESPLGPIVVKIRSPKIPDVVEWLAPLEEAMKA